MELCSVLQLGSTKFGSTFESTAALNYSSRPKLQLGSVHVKIDVWTRPKGFFLTWLSYDYITNLQLSEETKLSDLTENTHCFRLFNEQDIECYTKLNPLVQYELFLGHSTAWIYLFICRQITNQKDLKFSNLNRVLCIYKN